MCVGETKEEKNENITLEVIKKEILSAIEKQKKKKKIIIAYEPIWAIGTGVIPTNEEIQKVIMEIKKILPQNKDYLAAPDGETQIFFERPFLETQVLINECVGLTYEKKDTGVIVLRENSNAHKDHYSACSYSSWLSTLLEKDLFSDLQEYEVGVFVN